MWRVCGICGLYSPSGQPTAELVDDMRARIRHRGPDQGSTDALGACVLGHQRLQVLDPDLGYQPVADEAGDVTGDAGVGDGGPQRPLPERFLDIDNEKSACHDDKHQPGKGLCVRPDQVRDRTDPVTSSPALAT